MRADIAGPGKPRRIVDRGCKGERSHRADARHDEQSATYHMRRHRMEQHHVEIVEVALFAANAEGVPPIDTITSTTTTSGVWTLRRFPIGDNRISRPPV